MNLDVDEVECESCGATLKFVSSATWTPSEGESFWYFMTRLMKVSYSLLQFICMNTL